jgi:hypothetical protein
MADITAPNGSSDQRVTNAILGQQLREIEKTLCRLDGKLDAQGQQLNQSLMWIAKHEVVADAIVKRQDDNDKKICEFDHRIGEMKSNILRWNWGNSFGALSALIAGFYAIFGIGK